MGAEVVECACVVGLPEVRVRLVVASSLLHLCKMALGLKQLLPLDKSSHFHITGTTQT